MLSECVVNEHERRIVVGLFLRIGALSVREVDQAAQVLQLARFHKMVHVVENRPKVSAAHAVDFQPVNGRFKVPEEPGLGAEISPWAIEHSIKYVVE